MRAEWYNCTCRILHGWFTATAMTSLHADRRRRLVQASGRITSCLAIAPAQHFQGCEKKFGGVNQITDAHPIVGENGD
jgi:hypothetical protein